MRVGFSAPGKLVLLGEYAVLFGHPALVMAVDRRARVELASAPGRVWQVTAPGFADTSASFEIDPEGGVSWSRDSVWAADSFGLVEQVLNSLLATASVDFGELPPVSMVLDTRAFFQPSESGSVKLGLGSSAALTVALGAGMLSWAGIDDSRVPVATRLNRMLELHRGFQGGRGSGIDLAASLLGGVIEYGLDDHGAVRVADSLDLPEDLHLVVLWTGRSASTGSFLERLDVQLKAGVASAVDALDELGGIAAAGIEALNSGALSTFLGAVDSFADAMERLGEAAGLQILSTEHLELGRLARAAGAHYKPSGAGGGDVGIGFSDDPEALEMLTSNARAKGYASLDIGVDPLGLSRS